MEHPEESETPARTRTLTFIGLADVCAWVIGISTLAGFAGAWWWILDLCSHFRIQYFFGSLVLVAFYGLKRLKTQTAAATGIAVINLLVLHPHLTQTDSGPNHSGVSRMKVLWWNVQSANENKAASVEWILKEAPDLIALGEITADWEEELSRIKQTFPFDHIESREGNFGIALYSRHPLFNPKILYQNEEGHGVPSLQVELNIEGKILKVIATHPLPPIRNTATKARNSHLAWLSHYIQGIKQPTILLGDLNTTPWNHAFLSFLETSGLEYHPKGLFTTWPNRFFPLRIPLDYCLVGQDISVRTRRLGPSLGSDHSPVIAELTW